MSVVEELEQSIQTLAERIGPAVVGIGRGWGWGSGVVYAPGRVLTNAHAVRQDELTVSFADGRRESGQVIASDPDLDLAVVDVDTADAEPIEWGDAAEVPIGRAVLALANPGGRGLRVTPGFVSSTSRSFRGPRGRRIAGAIEHTAPLPRGSSGGPLVDRSGRLLGINSVRVDPGLILAIPADSAVRERVAALARGERPKAVRLGVAVAPPRVARRLRRAVGLPERDGVLIRGVEQGSAAERAGLERGDLIVSAAGREIDRVDALYEALDAARADGTLELTIVAARVSPQQLSVHPMTGQRLTIPPGCLCKALLLGLPSAEAEDVLARLPLPALTPKTHTDRAKLAEEIARAMIEWFWDDTVGAFFDTARDAEQLIARPRDVDIYTSPAAIPDHRVNITRGIERLHDYPVKNAFQEPITVYLPTPPNTVPLYS